MNRNKEEIQKELDLRAGIGVKKSGSVRMTAHASIQRSLDERADIENAETDKVVEESAKTMTHYFVQGALDDRAGIKDDGLDARLRRGVLTGDIKPKSFSTYDKDQLDKPTSDRQLKEALNDIDDLRDEWLERTYGIKS